MTLFSCHSHAGVFHGQLSTGLRRLGFLEVYRETFTLRRGSEARLRPSRVFGLRRKALAACHVSVRFASSIRDGRPSLPPVTSTSPSSFSNHAYKVGRTTSVSRVLDTIPPITTVASGR